MQRHPALQDLSRDHFDALALAQLIRRSMEGHEMGGTPEQAATRLVEAWEQELAWHFREEEEVLLPIHQRHVDPAEDETIRRVLSDHAWFRDEVPALVQALEAGEPIGDRVARIGERLHDHARLEDREWFPAIEASLSEAELDELAHRSRAYRKAHRGREAIGPRS